MTDNARNRLDGKVAIVTGAGMGMGAATARVFAGGLRLQQMGLLDRCVLRLRTQGTARSEGDHEGLHQQGPQHAHAGHPCPLEERLLWQS